jgi:hypothetical protein
MACQTCDHTMQSITQGVFWCPRCGTLKFESGVPQWERPSFLRTIMANLKHCDDSVERSEPGPMSGSLWAKASHLFGLGPSAIRFCLAMECDPESKAPR